MLVPHRETDLVAQFHFFEEHSEIDTLHATRSTHKASIDDFIGNTNGFKNLCTFIRLQSRDAHFGHDLQHTLADALFVTLHN